MNAETPKSLVIEREMPYPPEKIWRALTQGDLIKEWLMDNEFQPVVGHKFQFRSTPVPGWNGIVDSQILVVEPNKKLSYGWVSMGMESVVTWTLSAAGGGTMLRFEQSGFGPGMEAAYKGATYGWQRFIGNMEKVVGGLK
jgi:uncharacterized protein YndB with AHSA1/START domain